MVKDNALAQFPLLIDREAVIAKSLKISLGLLVSGICSAISTSIAKEF